MALSSRPAPVFMRLAGHHVRWHILTELAQSDLRVRELVTLVDQPQNLMSYHLRVLRHGGLVTATRSSFDGRDSYYHLDLDRCADALANSGAALHPALGLTGITPPPGPLPRQSVLFVCTSNSARSPMAETMLRRHAVGQLKVTSAGIHPKPQMHPDAVRILHDRFGADLATRRPRHLAALTGRRFDYVITLCDKAREDLLDVTGTPHFAHWSVPDPAAVGSTRSAFNTVATDIETRVRQLLPVLATTNARKVPP